MDRYPPNKAPRRRRGPAASRRRRGRAVTPAHPRLWWTLAAGLLLLTLLFPQRVRAQGLRSAVASVSIVAVKRDPLARPVRDFDVAPTWQGAVAGVSVKLAPGSDTLPLFVRGSTGRLVRVANDFVEVDPSVLRFRAIAPEGQGVGGASWQVDVRVVDAATGREHRTVTRLTNR